MSERNKLYFTTDDLLNSVKRRANIPDTQDMISDDEILEFANEEMLLNFIPLVYSKHEDYYLVRQEITLEAGKVRYPIPYRSIASKVREVALKNANNGLSEMTRISIDDVTAMSEYSVSSIRRYYFEGEEVVIHTDEGSYTPASGDKLVIFYNLRPNALVESDRIANISQILDDGTDATIYVNSIPSHWTSTEEIDFIKTKSPHRVISFDKTITELGTASANAYVKIPSSELPNSLSVGDRIASAGETDVLNAPSDLHVMLAQMVAERVLESIGDQAGLAAAGKKLAKMENNSSLILDNRSTGSPIKAKARNATIRRSGLGRRGR